MSDMIPERCPCCNGFVFGYEQYGDGEYGEITADRLHCTRILRDRPIVEVFYHA